MSNTNESPKPEIYNFFDKYSEQMLNKITKIEKEIAKDRDSFGKLSPIYLTRGRVKSREGAYLKTKRKNKRTAQDITDLIGIRVLCFVEQNLIDAYKYMLKYLNKNSLEITEVIIYLVDTDTRYKSVLEEVLEVNHSVKFIDASDKKSGYQSIHITGFFSNDDTTSIEEDKIPYEVQIRTLLQDVWGELEHKLAYKQKKQNKFIKNGFRILARNLKTDDIMLSHLFEYSEEDNNNEISAFSNPIHVFNYDTDNIASCLKMDTRLFDEYIQYKNIIYLPKFCESSKKTIEKAYGLFISLKGKMELFKLTQEDANVRYWIEMEEAFYLLLLPRDENDIIRAEHTYQIHWKESYIASFRLGQLNAHRNSFPEALMYFDHAYNLLLQKISLQGSNNDIRRNEMFIHLNVALIYWLQGSEYQSAVIDESKKAINILKDITDVRLYNRCLVLNSVTWYFSEIINSPQLKRDFLDKNQINIDAEFNIYFEQYQDVISKLEEEKNSLIDDMEYDTLAMCYFRKYKRDKKVELLDNAYKYIQKINSIDKNNNYYYYETGKFFREHYQLIYKEYSKMLNIGDC